MNDSSRPGPGLGRDTVEISVPLRMEHTGTVRLIVAALGADQGLSIDELDDLRLAVSEVFSSMVETAIDIGAERAFVRCDPLDGAVGIEMYRGVVDDEISLGWLATTILSSAVEECVNTQGRVSFVKRRRESD